MNKFIFFYWEFVPFSWSVYNNYLKFGVELERLEEDWYLFES